ncbi:MAG: hypothetical protein AAF675_13075, partial [Pseudomonadota bacterium]
MAQGTARLRFVEGARLDLDDLRTEQTFHMEQMRRHLLACHSWGILSGLELVLEPDGGFVVRPGMALDGFGRILLLEGPRAIPLQAFADREATELEVFLNYGVVTETSGVARRCQPSPADRSVERAFLTLALPDPARLPRSRPPGVAQRDLDYGPERDPAEDTRRWPVFLGRLRYAADATPPQAVDPIGRRYGGVRADRVEALSETAVLSLGPAPIEGPEAGEARLAYEVSGNGAPLTLFELHGNGDGTLRSNLAMTGDLVLRGSALAFEGDPLASNAEVPLPWSMQLVEGTTEQGLTTTDLQITLPQGDEGEAARFVVGAWSAEANAFQEILAVSAAGEVTVTGNLTQRPAVVPEDQPSAIPQLDFQSNQLLQSVVLNAITGTGSAIINALISGEDPGGLSPGAPGISGQLMADVLIEFMGPDANEPFLADFANRIRSRSPASA